MLALIDEISYVLQRIGRIMFDKLGSKGTSFKAGQVIFFENDNSNELFFLVDGAVEILKITGEEETSLAIFRKGDIFGEIAFFDKLPRSATARTIVDSKILVITSQMLEKQLKTLPPWFTALIKIITQRLRHTNDRLATFLLKDKMSQVSASLLDFSTTYGQKRGDDVIINYPLARKFMANNLGISLQDAKAGITDLAKRGLIFIEGVGKKRLLVISQLEKLKDFVNYLEVKEKFAKETNPKFQQLIYSEKDLHMLQVVVRAAEKVGQNRGGNIVLNYDVFCSEVRSRAGSSVSFDDLLDTLRELSLMIITQKETYIEKKGIKKILSYSRLEKEFTMPVEGVKLDREPTAFPELDADDDTCYFEPEEDQVYSPPTAGESYRIVRVAKEKLVPGMVLASPIKNNSDKVVLFEEDVRLSEEAIAQIQRIPHLFDIEIKADHKKL